MGKGQIILKVGADITAATKQFGALNRTVKKATGESLTRSQKFSKGLRVAAIPAAAALAGIGAAMKVGFDGLKADEAALAQLNNSLDATGNSATMSADGIFDYANALQDSTGYGADVITEGAAVLATFKNVRNEVGKGNEVFDRATKAGLDMAAKGLGDPATNAVLLGKALNDPLKGVSALTRVGVTFTDQQKDQIKTLMESGDVVGAQKIILGELEGQVGGAAEAYGETMAGQIERAKRSFEEIAKEIASIMIPIFNVLAGIVQKVAGFFREHSTIAKVLIGVIAALAAAIIAANIVLKIQSTLTKIDTAVKLIHTAVTKKATTATKNQTIAQRLLNVAMRMNPIGIIITAIAGFVAAIVIAYNKSETFRGIVQGVWEWLKTLGGWLVGVGATVFDGLKSGYEAIQPVIDTFVTAIKWIWETGKTAIEWYGKIGQAYFSGIKTAFELLSAPIDTVMDALAWIWDTGKKAVNYLKGKFSFSKLVSALGPVGTALKGIVSSLKWIWENAKSAFGAFGKEMPKGWQHPLRPGGPANPNGRSLQPMGRSTVNVNVVSGGDQRILVSEEQIARAVYRVLARSDARNGLEFA